MKWYGLKMCHVLDLLLGTNYSWFRKYLIILNKIIILSNFVIIEKNDSVLWRVLGLPLWPITMLFKGKIQFDSYKIYMTLIFAPLGTLSANFIEIEQLLYK